MCAWGLIWLLCCLRIGPARQGRHTLRPYQPCAGLMSVRVFGLCWAFARTFRPAKWIGIGQALTLGWTMASLGSCDLDSGTWPDFLVWLINGLGLELKIVWVGFDSSHTWHHHCHLTAIFWVVMGKEISHEEWQPAKSFSWSSHSFLCVEHLNYEI